MALQLGRQVSALWGVLRKRADDSAGNETKPTVPMHMPRFAYSLVWRRKRLLLSGLCQTCEVLTASGKNTGEDQVETGLLLSCFQIFSDD